MMLQKVRNFIREQDGKRRPSGKSDDAHERRLARWVYDQRVDYMNSKNIMRDDMKIREEWGTFVEAHATLFEDGAMAWRRTLRQLQDFIDAKSRQQKPSSTSKDADEKRLAKWMQTQQSNYAQNARIMKDVAIRKEWTRFVDAHATLFEDGAAAWRRTLRQLQDFIQTKGGNERPSQTSKDADEKRLANWIQSQRSNYAKNEKIMKDVAIREEWTRF
eukprot:4381627-Pleurochrysis_carterae.AAC.1